MPEIALYQPDMPPNVGTILRLCACLSVKAHIIEPCGFPFSRRSLQRSLMDYEPHVDMERHADFAAFDAYRHVRGQRLMMLTTKTDTAYTAAQFQKTDILLFGSESAGVPESVQSVADAQFVIPMHPDLRSINVATAAAMVIGEALRQCGEFPPGTHTAAK